MILISTELIMTSTFRLMQIIWSSKVSIQRTWRPTLAFLLLVLKRLMSTCPAPFFMSPSLILNSLFPFIKEKSYLVPRSITKYRFGIKDLMIIFLSK